MKRVRHLFVHFLTASLITVLAGCGGGGDNKPIVTATAITLSNQSGNLTGTLVGGRTLQLTGKVSYSNNTVSDLSGATWTSSNTSVATVDANGLVTAKTPGTAIITATYSGVSGTYTITVTSAVLQSFSFSTTNFSLALGRTQPLTLSGTMSDGTAATSSTFSGCTWSSSNAGVATLSPSTGAASMVSTVGAGSSTITVTCGSIVQTTTVTVTPVVIVSIAVTPTNPSISVGATYQFTATATMSNSTTQNVTSTATWSSSNTSFVTMDTGTQGLAHGVAAGSSTIQASQGGINGSTLLTVTSSTSTARWTRLLGSTDYDVAYGIARDASGNVYIAGGTTGNLDGQTNAGSQDAFIAKYDSSGNKQWVRLLGTTADDVALGIALDASGNVYIAGGTMGNLDGQGNAGSVDVFTAKYDSSGNKQWVRLLGSTADEYARSIALDSSGNVYIVGQTMGALDGQTNTGANDAFIAKYDSGGNKQWVKLLGSLGGDYFTGIAVDASGVYIVGYTSGNLDGQVNAYVSYYDVVTAKYDSSGNKQWVKLLGTTNDDVGAGIAVDASGVYIVGSTMGNLDGLTNAGNNDAFIAKFDSSSGNKQWVKLLGTTADDVGYGIALDASGSVYIAGGTMGNLDGQVNSGSVDAFIAKFDSSSGNKQWVKLLGSPGGDIASGIALDASGRIYVVGYTDGNLNGQTNAGSYDIFMAKAGPDGTWQ